MCAPSGPEYIPDVSLSFNYLSPFNVEFLPKNIMSVGFMVNWDIWDWGRKKKELAEKTLTVKQADLSEREIGAANSRRSGRTLPEARGITLAGRG